MPPRSVATDKTLPAMNPRTPSPLSPTSRPSRPRLGSLPVNSDEDLRFVQDRIGLFAKVVFLIALMFLVAPVVISFFVEPEPRHPVSLASHVGGMLIALAVWRVACQRKLLSPLTLQW